LHSTLVKHFKHKIGEERVSRRDYYVAQAHGGVPINEESWNDVRNSGEQLAMVMLIDKVLFEHASKLCPKCGTTPIGTYEDDGWRIW
jgi:hypothetical protein